MKTFRLLAAGVAVVLLLGGCGGGGVAGSARDEQNWVFEHLELNLDWEPGPENVGPQAADSLGYFDAVKLWVYVNTAIFPERPTKYVGEGLVEAAIAQAPQVLMAREEGRRDVIVGSLLPEATLSLMWLPKSGIEQVADLKGKTIAYPGVPFQRAFLEYILEGAGLKPNDVKLVDVQYDLVPALASGRADAIFGGSANEEGVLLEAQGMKPIVTPATDLGIPDFEELVLIARRDRYEKEPELFHRLLDASIRGNLAATEDPRAATKAIVEQSRGTAPEKPTEAGVKATAPLLSTDGSVDQAKLEDLIDWMYEQGMLKKKMSVSEVLAG